MISGKLYTSEFIKSAVALLLSLLVLSSYAQVTPVHSNKATTRTSELIGKPAGDSAQYCIYGHIFDTTGAVGLQQVQIIVSGSGLSFSTDAVSTFTNDKGAYRLFIPERLRKHKILYLFIYPFWGYESLQAITFRRSELPYNYTVSLSFKKVEKMTGCGGGVKSDSLLKDDL